jgi:hypothetical protein
MPPFFGIHFTFVTFIQCYIHTYVLVFTFPAFAEASSKLFSVGQSRESPTGGRAGI